MALISSTTLCTDLRRWASERRCNFWLHSCRLDACKSVSLCKQQGFLGTLNYRGQSLSLDIRLRRFAEWGNRSVAPKDQRTLQDRKTVDTSYQVLRYLDHIDSHQNLLARAAGSSRLRDKLWIIFQLASNIIYFSIIISTMFVFL